MTTRPASLIQLGDDLARRLVQCLPAATFEMETLVRLTSIEASRDIPTAAVTCEGRPRLLINPDFVEVHCQSDEHLFLLVMHELWHVILAHTRLYPRATIAQNVAFDAVINAGLAHELPAPEYRGFFEALNPPDRFPGLLLRPPIGWPGRPRYAVPGPRGTRDLLKRLYPAGHHLPKQLPTYAEILELIQRGGKKAKQPAGVCTVLLGDHDDPDTEARALDDRLLGDVVREIVAAWPPPPIPLRGRDSGRNPYDWVGALQKPAAEARRAFAAVLRRVLGRWPGSASRAARARVQVAGGLGPLPNLADRTLPARRALGASTLLRQQLVTVPVRTRRSPASVHVYVDVSGSMFEVLPRIAGLLAPWVRSGEARCFQFSNRVFPLALSELSAGRLRTTQGTDLDCVLEHWLETPVRRALVLTDGYVGSPRSDLAQAARVRKLELHAVLPGESAYPDDLEPLAASITVLPPLDGGDYFPRRNS
jgi:hypothetical protein